MEKNAVGSAGPDNAATDDTDTNNPTRIKRRGGRTTTP